MANDNDKNSVDSSSQPQTEEEIKAYWTKEKQADAKPLPVPIVELPADRQKTIAEPKKPDV